MQKAGRLSFSLVLAVGLFLLARPGHAHPHVWVDTVVTALLDNGKVTALKEEWWFDEEFTVMALSEVRKTKGMAAAAPKPLTDGEITKLKATAFSNLANYGYFTHVWAAGKPIGLAHDVTTFTARMDGARLAYTFTVPLAQPIDAKAVRVGIWDDTYYVDVGPAKGQAARVEGEGAASCRTRIIDDKDHPIYNGSIVPKVADIAC